MADVLLYHTDDGGEVNIDSGDDIELTDRLDTAVYLSLFGGNEDDDGSEATSRLGWWGNIGENNPDRRLVSRLQALLRKLAVTSGNLRLVSEAAEADLAWLVTTGVVSEVRVVVSLPQPKRLGILIELDIGQDTTQLRYSTAWGS